MGKNDEEMNNNKNVDDVEIVFNQIRNLSKEYRRVVDKLDLIKKDKKKSMEKLEFISKRNTLKESFISKKQFARDLIKLLRENLRILKDKELQALVDEFREIDADFRSLGVMAERDALMEGAPKSKRDTFDPTRAKNDDLLDKAANIQSDNLNKLKGGLQTIENTREVGKLTAAKLEEDREKLKRIDQQLDEVQGELELSQVLLTRFVKRIATDKVVIAFATLLILGIAGIITYSVLNPDQKIFNVPDIVKPDTAALSNAVNSIGSPSPTPTPSTGHVRLLRGE